MRGATIWTEGPQGILENADMVVVDGKIAAIGSGLAAPAGASRWTGRGKHVSPGIIDCHSHTAIDGNVNEGDATPSRPRSGSETSSIRWTSPIYRELAGGTTTANVLHGSANAIGGQNAIVKFRWGDGPDDLLLAGAPEGIKFALGENPKQSNFGRTAAAVSRDAHGRREPDPRALPRGARLPQAPGGVQ